MFGWLNPSPDAHARKTQALILKELKRMSAALDRAAASVGALETAVSAATAEIASLKAGSDDDALNGLADRIDTAAASLNTASGATPPPPVGQVG